MRRQDWQGQHWPSFRTIWFTTSNAVLLGSARSRPVSEICRFCLVFVQEMTYFAHWLAVSKVGCSSYTTLSTLLMSGCPCRHLPHLRKSASIRWMLKDCAGRAASPLASQCLPPNKRRRAEQMAKEEKKSFPRATERLYFHSLIRLPFLQYWH